MTNPTEQVDPLTKALDTLNLQELTGDSKINGAEAASLIRAGIRERNQWDTEHMIWGEVVGGAVDLSEARGWECDFSDPRMVENVVERLVVGKDAWGQYIGWCLAVNPSDLHFLREEPLGELELQLMRTNADKLLMLFRQHMPEGAG